MGCDPQATIMPQIHLEVETRVHGFVPSILESHTTEVGQSYASGPASVTYRGGFGRKAWGVPDVYQFFVEWGAEVTLAAVARWLYTKARGRVERMRINRREVRVDEDEILRVLREANPAAKGDGE